MIAALLAPWMAVKSARAVDLVPDEPSRDAAEFARGCRDPMSGRRPADFVPAPSTSVPLKLGLFEGRMAMVMKTDAWTAKGELNVLKVPVSTSTDALEAL